MNTHFMRAHHARGEKEFMRRNRGQPLSINLGLETVFTLTCVIEGPV